MADAELTIGLVNNDPAYIQAEFSRIETWIESYFPEFADFRPENRNHLRNYGPWINK